MKFLDFSEIIGDKNDHILRQLDHHISGSQMGCEGVAKLRELLAAVTAAGVSESRVKIDVSIARGLDYYTGTVFETFLDKLPGIGSVCSGGRYDNLAELFTARNCPASAPRSDWTASWLRWKNYR